VPRRRDRLLQVEAAVAEGGLRLERRRPVRSFELVRTGDQTHSLSPTPGRRLQQHRVAGFLRCRPRLVEARRSLRPRNDRHVRRTHLCLRLDLVAHPRHRLCAGADEGQVIVGTRGDEGGALGEKTPARVHGLAAGRRRSRNQRRNAEVALGGGGRTDADRAVGQAHVQRVAVGRGVDHDRLDVALVQRPDHPDGDLAAIRDQNSLEHG
jgi:hypothetical protein